MSLVKVTGTNFVRDTNSMALINTDDNAKNEYYVKARMISVQKEEINSVKTEIETLKDDIREIKEMLMSFGRK
jgi:hypothetical protein